MTKLSKEQIGQVKEMFAQFDKNGDGSIGEKELGTAFRALGMNPSKADVKRTLKELDTDGTGQIDFNEFIKMVEKQLGSKAGADPDKDLRKAFQVFDKDGSGFITASEFRNAMQTLGEPLSDEEIDQLMYSADVDGDGRINIDEFIAMMKG